MWEMELMVLSLNSYALPMHHLEFLIPSRNQIISGFLKLEMIGSSIGLIMLRVGLLTNLHNMCQIIGLMQAKF